MRNIIKIEFEDHGQDFLIWTVDAESGQIIDSYPFQTGIWSHYKVTNGENLSPGEYVNIAHDRQLTEITIKYPIVDVTSGTMDIESEFPNLTPEIMQKMYGGEIVDGKWVAPEIKRSE